MFRQLFSAPPTTSIIYSRESLLILRPFSPLLLANPAVDTQLSRRVPKKRRRGRRAGVQVRDRSRRAFPPALLRSSTCSPTPLTSTSYIPVIISVLRRPVSTLQPPGPPRTLTKPLYCAKNPPLASRGVPFIPPDLFIINPTSLCKPHALEHLAADLTHNSGVCIVAETWFKKHHEKSTYKLDGFTSYRRDRTGRRDGGVAIFVKDSLDYICDIISPPGDRSEFELLWVRAKIGNCTCFFGALYHPPKPIYNTTDVLSPNGLN